MRPWLMFSAAFLLFLAAASFGADRAVAVPVRESPTVDGDLLADDVWKRASLLGPLQPLKGTLPKHLQTVARVIYTPEALFVGAVCLDKSPFTANTVLVEVEGPTGRMVRARATLGAARDRFENTDSTVATTRQKEGWTAEFRFSLKTLTPPHLLSPRRGDVWRLALIRTHISADNRETGKVPDFGAWPAQSRENNTYEPGKLFFASANLLANGDAEQDADKDGLPDGWDVRVKGAPARVPEQAEAEKQWVLSGEQALWVNIDGAATVSLPAAETLRRGAEYRLAVAAWLPERDDTTARATLVIPGHDRTVSFAETPAYREQAVTFVAQTDSVRPQVKLKGRGSCYLDDAVLEMTQMPPASPRAKGSPP